MKGWKSKRGGALCSILFGSTGFWTPLRVLWTTEAVVPQLSDPLERVSDELDLLRGGGSSETMWFPGSPRCLRSVKFKVYVPALDERRLRIPRSKTARGPATARWFFSALFFAIDRISTATFL